MCAANSAETPSSAVTVKLRSGFAGALTGRTLKVNGDGAYLRYDRALSTIEVSGKVRYRATAVVEVPSPW
jgi:hypothetical protein